MSLKRKAGAVASSSLTVEDIGDDATTKKQAGEIVKEEEGKGDSRSDIEGEDRGIVARPVERAYLAPRSGAAIRVGEQFQAVLPELAK